MVSFEGVGENAATFCNSKTSAVSAGEVCKISANGEVSACADGDKFVGVVEVAAEEYASVQFTGFAKVIYSGADIGAGYAQLLADGSGGVRIDVGGKEYLVASVDTANKTAVILL